MKLNYNSFVALLCAALLSISNLLAQEGQLIPFQGTLYQSGTAVNGTVNITFTIDDPAWTETHENVSVTQGVYAVVLGESTAFPDDLFTTGTAPDLVVSIGGTDVATVPLYAPFISKGIVEKNMPEVISRTFDEDAGEHNGVSVVVDGAGAGQTAAVEGVAQSSTYNTGVEGFAVSTSENSETQNGVYGQSAGDGTGNHRGVVGIAQGSGKYNHGIKGIGQGDGNGDEGFGFGEGSINFGVEGNAGGNAWSNTGLEGSTFGTEGRVNYGVHGISSAGTFNTSDTLENYGVAGRAYGPGKNYGIYGGAGDGVNNWAGFFDGDVNINGDLKVNGQSINPGGGEPSSAGVFDSLVVQNADEEVRGKITSYDNGGLTLYDRLGEKTFEMMSNDTASHFFMYNENIRSSNGNRYPAFWMKNYNWGTYWQQIGIPLADDPDWEKTGAAYQQVTGNFASYTLETGNNKRKVSLQAGEDYGMIQINSQDNNKVVQAGGKFWEGRSDLGYVAVYGNPDTLDMVIMQAIPIDEGANEIGEITLNGTDGSSFTINSHGIQGQDGEAPHQVKNAEGEVKAELTYFDQNDAGSVVLYGANDSTKAILGTSGGGYAGGLWLYDSLRNVGARINVTNKGQSSLSTYNEQQKNTGWFGNYNNNGFMQILDYDDTGDVLQGGILAGFWAGHPELYMELDNGQHLLDMGIQDSSGYLWLRGANSDNIQMGAKNWEFNGKDLPYFKMNGSIQVDDGGGNFYHPDLVWMEAQNDGEGNEFGSLSMNSTNGYLATYGAREFELRNDVGNGAGVRIEVNHDTGGDDPTGYAAQLSLSGTNGDNVQLGAKTWETNGHDLPFLSMRGSAEIDNGEGEFYKPDLVWMEAQRWEDGTELGALTLRGTDGSEFSINSQGNIWTPRAELQSNWGNDGQGALILKDATDAWMIQASVNDDGAANYSGTITAFNSQNNFLTEMGGDGYISIHEVDGAGDVVRLTSDGSVYALNNLSTSKTSIQSDWGNDGQGALQLNDASDNTQARLSVNDDGSGNYFGNLELTTNQGNDSRMTITSGGINMGENAYANGIVMNYDNSGGGVFEMYSGSTQQVFMNGSNGDASFQGTAWANFFESPNGFNSSSDARFKKNVKSIDGALAKTQQLNGYTYNWNKLAKKQKGIDNKDEQVGVLAQELEAVFPQLVKTDEQGYKSVNYAALTAVLIEAVKELSEQVTNLQGENAELKAELTKVDQLEIKIDLIQKLLAKQTMEASKATVSR